MPGKFMRLLLDEPSASLPAAAWRAAEKVPDHSERHAQGVRSCFQGNVDVMGHSSAMPSRNMTSTRAAISVAGISSVVQQERKQQRNCVPHGSDNASLVSRCI